METVVVFRLDDVVRVVEEVEAGRDVVVVGVGGGETSHSLPRKNAAALSLMTRCRVGSALQV